MYMNGRNVVITKEDIEKACRCSNPTEYLGLKLAEFVKDTIEGMGMRPISLLAG